MNEPRRRTLAPRARWAVPVVAAVAVGLAFAAPPLFASADDAGLPTISPEELAAQVAGAEPSPLSGTVVYTARLGLPELPFGDVGGANPVALLGGSSTMRVWSDGGERSRVALLGADVASTPSCRTARRRGRTRAPTTRSCTTASTPPTPPGTTS